MKFIPQLNEMDCGVACLVMIAQHYGSHQNRTNLRELTGADKSGTSMAGLLYAAEKIGLEASAYKCTEEAIMNNFSVPFIAHVKLYESDNIRFHFVVVEKIRKNKITILDPANGKINVSFADFLICGLDILHHLNQQQVS